MLSPRGGPWADVGHLITFAISTLGNLTNSLGPRVGTFDFFGEENWSLIACCLKAAILNARNGVLLSYSATKASHKLLRCCRFFQKFINITVISKLSSVIIKDENEQCTWGRDDILMSQKCSKIHKYTARYSDIRYNLSPGQGDLTWFEPFFFTPGWGFWLKILQKNQMPHICPGSPPPPPSGLTLIGALQWSSSK